MSVGLRLARSPSENHDATDFLRRKKAFRLTADAYLKSERGEDLGGGTKCRSQICVCYTHPEGDGAKRSVVSKRPDNPMAAHATLPRNFCFLCKLRLD